MNRRVLALALAASAAAGLKARPGQAPLEIPPTAERAYQAIAPRFDARAAMEVVAFMDRYWRIAGNPGFNASINEIRDRLTAAGFSTAASTGPSVRVEEFPNASRGWDYRVGSVEFDGSNDAPLLSREQDRVSLAINSFSTPPDGTRAALVDVGAGAPPDFANRDLTGAVVLGDAPLGPLWQEAVTRRGAVGVISTQIAPYIRPSDSAQMSEQQRDVLQWGSIPYDATIKGFGFKASARAATRMRERLRRGPVTLRVTIQSTFYDGPNRTLVAEIPGRSAASQRVVIAAHVQEPGANDDASGCATVYGLARAIAEAIRTGALPQPDRTLTFLWVDEMRGSRQWITSHPEQARAVQYMFAMDMTGEDTSRTGGTFLIEKEADPSAVWSRPSDPHTEWGASSVKAESLKGSLLNDVHYAISQRRALETGWVVRTNPYEGGSDHTAFRAAGVPSLLNWHFTDRFYHTNQDTLDKVSADEMRNVGVAVATSAWLLAAATESDAIAVVRLLEAASAKRFATERAQGAEPVILDAWVKWYGEAFDSVRRLPAGGATDALRQRVAAAKSALSAPR